MALLLPTNADHSSLHSSPPEILAQIFRYTLPTWTFPGLELDQKEDSEFCALTLGAICKRWRTIAWSTPRLWSTVSITVTNADRMVGQVVLLDAWLSRSGDLPLNVELREQEEARLDPSPLVAVASKYASRWRSLSFQLPIRFFANLPGPDIHLPLLTSLHIRSDATGPSDIVSLRGATSLLSISLNKIFAQTLDVCLSNITYFKFNHCSADECLFLLAQCPAVVEAHFTEVFPNGDLITVPLPKIPMLLPSLNTLFLQHVLDREGHRIFDSLICPKTTLLTFSGDFDHDLGSLQTFISHCSNLSRLTICSPDITSGELQSLLQGLNDLPSFYLIVPKGSSNDPLNKQTLETMRIVPGRKLVLPKLETFVYFGPQTFSWGQVASIYRTRRSERSMVLTRPDSIEPEERTVVVGEWNFILTSLWPWFVSPDAERDMNSLLEMGVKIATTFRPSSRYEEVKQLSGIQIEPEDFE